MVPLNKIFKIFCQRRMAHFTMNYLFCQSKILNNINILVELQERFVIGEFP